MYSSVPRPRRRGPVNGDECYFWRTTGCHFGDKCRYKHIPDQKSKDRKPWQPWPLHSPSWCTQKTEILRLSYRSWYLMDQVKNNHITVAERSSSVRRLEMALGFSQTRPTKKCKYQGCSVRPTSPESRWDDAASSTAGLSTTAGQQNRRKGND